MTLAFRQIGGFIGAEGIGLDLKKTLDEDMIRQAYQGLVDHQVVFFRAQDISPERFEEFATGFGSLLPPDPGVQHRSPCHTGYQRP
jgi:taurine dioxygenase